jgi:acetate kinase
VRILTVNAGSTSLKLEAYELAPPLPPIGEPPDPIARYERLDEALADQFDAVAHRIVRVPDGWEAVTLLDPAAEMQIERVGTEAPLHDAPALRTVAALRAARAGVPQYAVADGAFHRTLSPAAYTYAIPRELSRSGLRRRGFHGLSHEYCAHRAARMAERTLDGARIVTLHLGGGSSLCAVRDGASVDTTMGYTPLEGIPMATRSGSVDPGVLTHLMRAGMTADAIEDMLERRSGLLGISGRSGDVRELIAARDDADARLALEVFVWRTRAALGAMIATLGGVDLIGFTGGIGENAESLRAQILLAAGAWGSVAAYVVGARENWMLGRALARARS